MLLKKIRNLLLILCAPLFLFGCATSSYVGDDYNANNIQTIKTDADLVFDVYKKTVDNANIKVGISKTPVPEVLALYIQVENLSYETPYTFKVEDLRLSNKQSYIPFITSSNYLNIYNNQEASSMAAMSSMGANIANMTGMTANMNEFNQTMMQNSAQQSTDTTFSQLERVGNQIAKHSIKHSSTISPRKSQYFYFFFEDLDDFPIYVKYKTLSYQFNL